MILKKSLQRNAPGGVNYCIVMIGAALLWKS